MRTGDRQPYARVLRWVFRRGDETLTCELGLTSEDSAYELRMTSAQHPDRNLHELFDDAMPAFQRHAAIERALVDEGWSLESFESQRITPDR
jgi:hypothetical protein